MGEHPPSERVLRVPWTWIGASAALLIGLWLLDLYVLRTGLLTRFRGQDPLTPLYTFWIPVVRPTVILFPIVAALFVWIAPRLVDPERTSRARFALILPLAAVSLAFALFLVREAPGDLGTQWRVYRNEEFWHDALRITDVRAFLAHHVELMPRLSTHGRHYPPGNAALLYGVTRAFGPNEWAAGATVLAFAAASLPLAFLALRQVATESAARQGALLVAFAPTFLDHACTAMDAVFLFFAALALWLGLRACGPRGRWFDAVLAGCAFLLATCFSFSTFPLGLAVTIYALFALRARAWKPLVVIGAAYVVCALLLQVLLQFSLWDAVLMGQKNAHEFMARVSAGKPNIDRARLGYGNSVAFLIGAGAPLVAAAYARFRLDGIRRSPWRIAAVLALAVMAFAPLHYLETERIWLYAVPWVAGAIVCDGPLDAGSIRRIAAASLAQAFLMECLLYTLW